MADQSKSAEIPDAHQGRQQGTAVPNRRDYRRARKALWRPQYREWLANHLPAEIWAVIAGGAIVPVAVAAVTRWLGPDKAPSSLGEVALQALVIGIIGAAAGLLSLLAFKAARMRLAAPANLWIAGQLEIEGIKADTAQAIEKLSAEIAAHAEASNVSNVKGRVQIALRGLFDAYRELEIVSNRTNDDAWNLLSQRLEEYKSAYQLLPPVARRFHETAPALAFLIRDRRFERLSECMNDASDIMLNGECELDLTIAQPNPIVITTRAWYRNRFVILNMVIGNREDTTVSLYPIWHLYLDPGRAHAVYHADAEPLQDWEEHRRQAPRSATPPLAMPLLLQPHSAATGYWCFFIGNDLVNDKRLQGGRRHLETVLEIHDLASGRRTKSGRIHLGKELIQGLSEPADDDEPTPPEAPEPSKASG